MIETLRKYKLFPFILLYIQCVMLAASVLKIGLCLHIPIFPT
jgi:hypothetical protein